MNFFFFKHRTGEERRISDWGSDVCSADLTSCYIGCGVTTGVGAVVNTAKVQVGDNVVIFGLGGIGLNVIQGAKLAGAGKIIGVDINPDREEWGRKFGMTDFLNTKGLSREESIAQIQTGRASGRERGCQSGEIMGVDV